MDRKTNRSNKYQSLFTELQYSNDMMSEFSEQQGLFENYKPEDRDKLMDLRDDLKKEFWNLVDRELTGRQRQVIHLCADGYTQTEIAKQLHVNQSSITKSINGNCDYRHGRRSYGGAKKRLKKLSENSPAIKDILRQIAEIHEQYK